MGDFSQDDLFEAIDRSVRHLLAAEGVTAPPVDAVTLAQDAFGLTVVEREPDDEPEPGRFGPRPPRRRSREVVLHPGQSEAARQAVCARACAKELVPGILTRLGVTPGTEARGAANQLAGLIAPRLLLPGPWFERDARRAGFDLLELKDRYPTVGYELLILRTLDIDEPAVVAVVDDGTATTRRSNRQPVGRALFPAEVRCCERVRAEREPQRVRHDGWTTQGWPIPDGPFDRIILRSVPDEV
jgi:predicted transcriptional regulator